MSSVGARHLFGSREGLCLGLEQIQREAIPLPIHASTTSEAPNMSELDSENIHSRRDGCFDQRITTTSSDANASAVRPCCPVSRRAGRTKLRSSSVNDIATTQLHDLEVLLDCTGYPQSKPCSMPLLRTSAMAAARPMPTWSQQCSKNDEQCSDDCFTTVTTRASRTHCNPFNDPPKAADSGCTSPTAVCMQRPSDEHQGVRTPLSVSLPYETSFAAESSLSMLMAGSGELHMPSPVSSVAEIKMVWPVCVALEPGTQACSLDITLAPSTSYPQHQNQQQQSSPNHHSCSGTVLVVAGSSLDLVARVPVENGYASCSLQAAQLRSIASRSCSTSGSSVAGRAWPATMQRPCSIHVLTLFAMGNGSDTGPAINVLCGPPEVASELNLLFVRLERKILSLENNPSLPHLQLRDVHGFMYLPGTGSTATATAAQAEQHLFSGPASSRQQEVDAHYEAMALGSSRCRPQQDSTAAVGQQSEREQEACHRTWACHFQPFVREVSYLLTCVPGAFADHVWDHRTYCMTLVSMVAFLEHHHCWHTLSALLLHADSLGVAFCYQGERLVGEFLSAQALECLLLRALHDDVKVQYMPQQEVQQHGGQFPMQPIEEAWLGVGPSDVCGREPGCSDSLSSSDSDEWKQLRMRHRSNGSCGVLPVACSGQRPVISNANVKGQATAPPAKFGEGIEILAVLLAFLIIAMQALLL